MHTIRVKAAALAAALSVFAGAGAGADPERGAFSFTFENDIVSGADRDYTNGVRLDYISPKNDLTLFGAAARENLGWLSGADAWYETFAVGQNIYTPSDITDPNPPPGERPYSGFLYGSYGLVADRGDQLDTIAIDIGVVGPPSLAEPTQKFVHELINSDKPMGWDNQLETEPAFRVIYERKYRYNYDFDLPVIDLGVDAAPHFNVALGTIDTSVGVGGTVRIGQDLGDDYGPPRVRPAVSSPGFFVNQDGFSWYLFAGAEARFVGRNLFLEGNTFGQQDGVTINRVVADLQVGAALQVGAVELSYTHVLRTEEFKAQDRMAEFGSLNIRTKF